MSELTLVKPTNMYARQVMEYRKEMLAHGSSLDGSEGLEEVDSFEEWIDFERRLRDKFKDGYVPSDVYLAVRKGDDRVVGIIDYRHCLTDYLLQFGGNIGYCIRPSERRKGYATEMLNLLLAKCRDSGVSQVLLTCNQTNEGSRKTILNNHGVLENEVVTAVGPGETRVTQRYWITL